MALCRNATKLAYEHAQDKEVKAHCVCGGFAHSLRRNCENVVLVRNPLEVFCVGQTTFASACAFHVH